ncbi:3-hydroxyacyl-CoA dehydrogenase NAD-binding domain-containing protein [Blastococcus sp. CT_GayMR16]|uniref:3-hydroxyacyl-CoA dehydrogenase NAD-binding domain-containing protein n=1 Tax=Blastococcus sp. CT_GayMR16 TaxID=2559607 RepID=UPI0010741951|nr:3-hydroxyacyl-CoA dehydrogenase NAD-binding domain-containing protein [Blastococcus sp. CT_GayMR16]TFV91057.1 hydroxylacyl-CoA dehydrogenase [Blastococcus sp. CT_GayMR16]
MSENSRSVAVIGAGTIGLSWATVFAAHGLQVRLTDPRPDVRQVLEESVRQFARTLPGGPRDAEELLGRIEVAPDLEAAVSGVDVVQENGPERIELKRELFARVEEAAPAEALILSSTSGLMPTELSRDMRTPGRLLVGHPFNPPHVLPLVEIVPGERTEQWAVDAAVEFYRGLGKKPVVLHREVPGFVANRLQSAIFKECVHLVLEGVVDVAELDEVVTESIGLRWSTQGPFESMHLGGGPGGLRHLFEHLGPGMSRRWKSLGQPELTPETIETISGQVEERFRDRRYDEMTEARDRAQLAVLAAREAARGEGDG